MPRVNIPQSRVAQNLTPAQLPSGGAGTSDRVAAANTEALGRVGGEFRDQIIGMIANYKQGQRKAQLQAASDEIGNAIKLSLAELEATDDLEFVTEEDREKLATKVQEDVQRQINESTSNVDRQVANQLRSRREQIQNAVKTSTSIVMLDKMRRGTRQKEANTWVNRIDTAVDSGDVKALQEAFDSVDEVLGSYNEVEREQALERAKPDAIKRFLDLTKEVDPDQYDEFQAVLLGLKPYDPSDTEDAFKQRQMTISQAGKILQDVAGPDSLGVRLFEQATKNIPDALIPKGSWRDGKRSGYAKGSWRDGKRSGYATVSLSADYVQFKQLVGDLSTSERVALTQKAREDVGQSLRRGVAAVTEARAKGVKWQDLAAIAANDLLNGAGRFASVADPVARAAYFRDIDNQIRIAMNNKAHDNRISSGVGTRGKAYQNSLREKYFEPIQKGMSPNATDDEKDAALVALSESIVMNRQEVPDFLQDAIGMVDLTSKEGIVRAQTQLDLYELVLQKTILAEEDIELPDPTKRFLVAASKAGMAGSSPEEFQLFSERYARSLEFREERLASFDKNEELQVSVSGDLDDPSVTFAEMEFLTEAGATGFRSVVRQEFIINGGRLDAAVIMAKQRLKAGEFNGKTMLFSPLKVGKITQEEANRDLDASLRELAKDGDPLLLMEGKVITHKDVNVLESRKGGSTVYLLQRKDNLEIIGNPDGGVESWKPMQAVRDVDIEESQGLLAARLEALLGHPLATKEMRSKYREAGLQRDSRLKRKFHDIESKMSEQYKNRVARGIEQVGRSYWADLFIDTEGPLVDPRQRLLQSFQKQYAGLSSDELSKKINQAIEQMEFLSLVETGKASVSRDELFKKIDTE